MSPTMLFNVYIVNLEKEIRKKKTNRMVIRKKKLSTISYADDVLLIKSEQDF